MRTIFFITCLWIFNLQINAQALPPINCTEAVSICDSIEVQDTLKVTGSTSADEISSNSCLPYGEVRGTWYKFGVNATGDLRFIITPLDTTVDFDWALFNTSWNPCTDIFGVPAYEISCNASGIGGGNYTTGATGLLQQGHNPAINVNIPSFFYLYITTTIDYINDTNVILGYTIDFSASDFNLVNCNEIGIEEEGSSIIHVYPNPVDDILQIRFNTSIEKNAVYLYDMNGRNVLAYKYINNSSMLDVSYLSPGIYILEVHTDKGISRKKIIKN